MTANCAITRTSRTNQRRPPDRATATAPFRSRTRFRRVASSAGTRPASTPAPTANAAVNRTARPCTTNSKVYGSERIGDSTAPSRRSMPHARASPAAAPRDDSTSVSVNSCCTRRRRLAPMASRTPISRRRAAARASSMPITFAHATSRTTPTMNMTAAAPPYAGPAADGSRRTSSVRVNETCGFSLESGNAAARPAMIVSRFASACARPTSSRSLPLMKTQRCPRRSSRVSPGEGVCTEGPAGVTSSTRAMGIHRSPPGMGGMP